MKLRELHPVLRYSRISFDCPICGPSHRCVIPFGKGLWNRIGKEVDELTITPSYQSLTGCGFHANIERGEVRFAQPV